LEKHSLRRLIGEDQEQPEFAFSARLLVPGHTWRHVLLLINLTKALFDFLIEAVTKLIRRLPPRADLLARLVSSSRSRAFVRAQRSAAQRVLERNLLAAAPSCESLLPLVGFP
jgi:hypothetical protein